MLGVTGADESAPHVGALLAGDAGKVGPGPGSDEDRAQLEQPPLETIEVDVLECNGVRRLGERRQIYDANSYRGKGIPSAGGQAVRAELKVARAVAS